MKFKLMFSIFTSLMVINMPVLAGLKPLNEQQMQSIQAQSSAATIDWQLSLNQTSPGMFDSITCSDLRFCRLGLSLNNRFDDKSYISRTGQAYNAAGGVMGDATNGEQQVGRKQWLVFKGVQGSIHLRDIEIGGADLIYRNKGNTEDILKPALQLTFDEKKPIEIRNLGFSALAIETDELNGAGFSASDLDGDGSTSTPGYLAKGTYTTPGFDFGRETGFTGLSMNGNLALQGTIKVFGCDGTHPRC